MKAPLVSIIIPTFNYGHFIIETLQSVSAQSYQNWECIIIDDGSTDNTAAVVKAYIQRHPNQSFTYVHIPNAGSSNARNVGIMQAKGIYLQFLDADDLLLPDKISIQVGLLSQENAALVYSRSQYFYHNGDQKVYTEYYPKGFLATGTLVGYSLIKALLKNNIITISSALVIKELVVKAGMFDVTSNHNEDWLLWFKIAILHPVFVFDDHVQSATEIRLHQLSSITSQQKMFEGEVFVRNFFHNTLSIQFDENQIKVLKKYNQDLLALHQIRSLQLKLGLSYVIKSFLEAPFANCKLLGMAGFRLIARTLKS